MAALVQSESTLKEQVSSLEVEKQQLASTAARLQNLLASLGIQTTPDGHSLAPPDAEFHAPQITAGGHASKS